MNEESEKHPLAEIRVGADIFRGEKRLKLRFFRWFPRSRVPTTAPMGSETP